MKKILACFMQISVTIVATASLLTSFSHPVIAQTYGEGNYNEGTYSANADGDSDLAETGAQTIVPLASGVAITAIAIGLFIKSKRK